MRSEGGGVGQEAIAGQGSGSEKRTETGGIAQHLLSHTPHSPSPIPQGLASSIVVISMLYFKTYYTIAPSAVYRLAMRQLRDNKAVTQVGSKK